MAGKKKSSGRKQVLGMDTDVASLWIKRIIFWAIGIGVVYNLITKVFM